MSVCNGATLSSVTAGTVAPLETSVETVAVAVNEDEGRTVEEDKDGVSTLDFFLKFLLLWLDACLWLSKK